MLIDGLRSIAGRPTDRGLFVTTTYSNALNAVKRKTAKHVSNGAVKMTDFFKFALETPTQFFGTLCLLFILYAMIIGIIRTIKLREK